MFNHNERGDIASWLAFVQNCCSFRPKCVTLRSRDEELNVHTLADEHAFDGVKIAPSLACYSRVSAQVFVRTTTSISVVPLL